MISESLCPLCGGVFPPEDLQSHIIKCTGRETNPIGQEEKDKYTESISTSSPPKQEEHPNLNRGNNNEENKWAMKFNTPEKRQELCREYCSHIEQGFSDHSFPKCDAKTFKKYVDNFPEDFPTDLIAESQSRRMMHWERIGMNGTMGVPVKYKGANGSTLEAKGKFNDRSWKFIMQNMFKWKERVDTTSDDQKLEAPMVIYKPARREE